MADFPLKQEAAEVQEIISGAVLFNKGTSLTEAEQAQARANIGASAFGEGINLIGHFDTLEELEAAIPDPEAGKTYSVGTESPYSLYAYDFINKLWRNYGAIRAADISARLAQNLPVSVSSWEEDIYVFTDYIYKAQIPLDEMTGSDFPMVAFAPFDAASGNYAPICYAFDGYVEIWAKAIPAEDIVIQTATFIIMGSEAGATGSSTKGITNASGSIATGGIDTAKLADGSVTVEKVAAAARTQYFDVAVGTEGWKASGPWTLKLEAADLTADTELTVALSGESTAELEAAFAALSWSVAAGVISFTSSLEPSLDIPVSISYTATGATEATTLEATLAAEAWAGAAPYTQSIAVEGLLETDRAVVRFSAPDNFDELEAQQEAFALLYTAESADGAITFYAKGLPETAFNAVLEVARI